MKVKLISKLETEREPYYSMSKIKAKNRALSRYLDQRQSEGFYYFTQPEVLSLLGYVPRSFQKAAKRLIRQNRLLSIKPGFFIIVPPEYKTEGSLPPTWFVEPLMSYLALPYYVGLQSAAALYSGDSPIDQPFQVMTNSPLSRVDKKGVHLRFLKNIKTPQTPCHLLKTEGGTLTVSTPEATALDLVKFYKSSRGFNQVATVLSGLVTHLKADDLWQTAKKSLYERAIIQRLGYLLSLQGVLGEALAHPLAEWIAEGKPRYVRLAPYHKYYAENERDVRWRVLINESIEGVHG